VSAPVVVAAFEPFGGRARNRAHDAVARVERRPIVTTAGSAHPVAIATLPTAFAPLPDALTRLLVPSPRALLLVGESAAARTLLVERVARNLADARIPDNAGAQPRAAALVAGAPLALDVPSALVARLVAAAQASGMAAAASAHGGTFCCNAALFHALWLTRDRPLPIAFAHVPARWPWADDRRAARALRALAAALAAAPFPVEERASPHG